MTRALIVLLLCLALPGCSWGLFCYPKSCVEWLLPAPEPAKVPR